MCKPLLLAAIAALTAHFATVLKKDEEILRLKKLNTQYESYEHFTAIFTPAYEQGVKEGMRRCGIYPGMSLN